MPHKQSNVIGTIEPRYGQTAISALAGIPEVMGRRKRVAGKLVNGSLVIESRVAVSKAESANRSKVLRG